MQNNNAEEDRLLFLSQAEILLQENKFTEALNIAETRIQRFPLDLDANIIAANVFINMGKIEDAENILHKVENTILDLSQIYIRIGNIYQEKGYSRQAVLCYKKYISLNPDSEQTKEIAKIISRIEHEEPLLADIEETCATENGGPEFHTVTLADLYIRQGHFSMAAEILQKILRLEPENTLAKAKLDTVNTAIALQAAVKKDPVQSNILIDTMSRWLENINRLKGNDSTEK